MKRPESREEYRKELAEAFAAVLEEKGLSWRKDWQGKGGTAPRNGVTKAPYRGTNAFLLSLTAMERGYPDPRWVTMVQIMDRKGLYHPKEKWHLRAGSRATYVEYWYPFDLREKKAMTWEGYKEALKAGRKEADFFFHTRYTAVFNASEVDGIPELTPGLAEEEKMDELVWKLSDGMGVPILFDGGDAACYSPWRDQIHLPSPESFENEYAFNAAALHELAHATGHPARLCRPQASAFGTELYAYEELVAEMSACFMSFGLKAEPDERHLANHRAYVRSWIGAVREKPDTLIRAIRDAQAAAGYMDWKAGFLSDREYEEEKARSFETRVPGREHALSR